MDTQTLGEELASKLKWDGLGILYVARVALEDANFHEGAVRNAVGIRFVAFSG